MLLWSCQYDDNKICNFYDHELFVAKKLYIKEKKNNNGKDLKQLMKITKKKKNILQRPLKLKIHHPKQIQGYQ